jgi:hypothetical protein
MIPALDPSGTRRWDPFLPATHLFALSFLKKIQILPLDNAKPTHGFC